MKPMVIVEGVYSLSTILSDLFELSLWVECPRDVRLARGLARDGEGARGTSSAEPRSSVDHNRDVQRRISWGSATILAAFRYIAPVPMNRLRR